MSQALMSTSFRIGRLHGALGAALLALTGSADAHVTLNSPNGGELLEPGSTVTIEWVIAISHNLQNWDLWYSATGAAPWTPIAMDLAPGSSAVGSIHTYNWVVPATASSQVKLRVRMDNSGTDYFDVSNSALSILSFGGDATSVSLLAGGSQNMTLGTSAAHSGMLYMILGSATGTSPGVPVGSLVLPLVADSYLQFTLLNPNTLIAGSLGFLDGNGQASAVLAMPPGLDPGLAGVTLNHAYAVVDLGGSFQVVHTSNADSLALTP
jgi:hypothetical protein